MHTWAAKDAVFICCEKFWCYFLIINKPVYQVWTVSEIQSCALQMMPSALNHAKTKAYVIFFKKICYSSLSVIFFSPTSSLTDLASCAFRLRNATAFVLYLQSLSKAQIYFYVGQVPSWKVYRVHYPDGNPWWLQAFKLSPIGSNHTRPGTSVDIGWS